MTRARDMADVLARREIDLWRLTADITGTNADITANLERADDAAAGLLGTGMTQASGVFTFPRTGIWYVQANACFSVAATDSTANLIVNATVNNGSAWDAAARAVAGNGDASNSAGATAVASVLLDVTDTAQVKVKFTTNSLSGSTVLFGDTDQNETHFVFQRIGDT